MGKFYAYAPEQSFLLPPSPRDWLPCGHLVFFINETVDQLDLNKLGRKYSLELRGEKAYPPEMLLKVLLYGYATGVFSSREIARKLYEDVAFRYLGAGLFPAHRTICRFRQDNLEEVRGLFEQVVGIACEAGLVKLGLVAIDGSKVKANASKHKAMSYERMQSEEKRLKGEVQRLLKRAEEEDSEEDEQFGELSGDEIPEELKRREDRLETIRAAKQRLEERQREKDREKGRSDDDDRNAGGNRPQGGCSKFSRDFGVPEPKAQENFTDPESRIMKTSSSGYQQCYNGQVIVDAEAQIIVAADVSQNAADTESLIPLIEQTKDNVGQNPKRVAGDSGFRSEENFKALERKKIIGLIALGREGKPTPERKSEMPATDRMDHRLATKRGMALYARRKAIVEPVFGIAKHVLGFRSFLLRGTKKVKAEWLLVCTALNLKCMSTRMRWT